MRMGWQLSLALVLNVIIQALNSTAYATRIAGVHTRQIATALSLFGLVAATSRAANMFYAPMIGTLSDNASKAIASAQLGAATLFMWQMRAILFAATVGAVLGVLLIPTFVRLYVRGIESFNRSDSFVATSLRLLDVRVLKSLAEDLRLPSLRAFGRFPLDHVPVTLLLANCLLTSVYTVGVVASTYASVLNPGVARTALLLSSIINGFGTIALAFIVDPTSARMVDRAVTGARTMYDVRSMVFWLGVTTICGTLCAQLLLEPASAVIAMAAHFVSR
jgi:hypothetical protein